MNKSTKRISQVFAGLAIACLAGCGSGDNPIDLPDVIADLFPPPATATVSYSGPGSQWGVELDDDSTFTITRRPSPGSAIDMTVEGTYENTDLGFVLLTVGSGTGPDAPEPGDVAWAIEAPGYALMLHTDGDRFIPMIEAGTCPEADMLSNWVVARTRLESDPTETDGDYFGSFDFVADTGVASLPSRYALSDNFPGSGAYDALDPVSCADGIAMFDDGEMYLTTNGGAIVHSNTSDPDDSSVIFALSRKQISSVAALDAEYVGVLFDASNGDDERVSAVILGCGGGQCSGQFVSNVAAGTTAGSFFIDLFGSLNHPETGFLTGVVRNEAGETGNLACAVDENVLASGGSMLSCAGQAPGDNTRLLNLFMVSN